MLSGDNGLLQRATDAKEKTERAEIVENARLDVLAQIAENKGEDIKEDKLKAILEKYFSDVPEILPDDLSDLDLTSINGAYSINGKEIYEGKVKNAELKLSILDIEKFRKKFRMQSEEVVTKQNNNTYRIGKIFTMNFLSFEKVTNLNDNIMNEGNNLATNDSDKPLYIWFEKERTENIQTYKGNSPIDYETDSFIEIDIGKLYYYSDGILTFDGDISQLFSDYRGANIDLSEWNTTRVNKMNGLFERSKNLINVNLNNWDISNVVSTSGMFQDCSSLKQIDFRGKDTSKISKAEGMFSGCTNLESVYFNNCIFADNCNLLGCFSNCNSLKLVDMSNVDMSTASNIGGLFGGVAPEKIIAPINVKSGMGNSVGFPGTQYNGSDGNTYTGLPEGKTESIILTKK